MGRVHYLLLLQRGDGVCANNSSGVTTRLPKVANVVCAQNLLSEGTKGVTAGSMQWSKAQGSKNLMY